MADPHAPFLRAVIARPDDDLPRLVYADWLDEQGDSDRAEFIRLQCQLALAPLSPADERKAQNLLNRARKGAPVRLMARTPATLRLKECLLLAKHPHDWLPEAVREMALFSSAPREDAAAGRTWRCGFVERIACTWADWVRYGTLVRAETPLRAVTLTDWPQVWGQVRDVTQSATVPGNVSLHGEPPYSWSSSTRNPLVSGEYYPDACQKMLAEQYPGLTFALPANEWRGPNPVAAARPGHYTTFSVLP